MNVVAIYLVYVTLGISHNQARLFRLMDTADYAAEQESQFDDMGQFPADAAETYSIGDRQELTRLILEIFCRIC